MKLNLLPTHVSKEGQQKTFIALAVLLLLLSIGAAAFLVISSRQRLDAAIAASEAPKANYASALAYSAEADRVILQATDADKHIKLAEAMDSHNTAYIKLYRTIFDFIPSYMRVRSITASPTGPDSVTVTLTGVISTYQQYADTVMALLRITGPSIGMTAPAPGAAPAAAPATPAAPAAPGAAPAAAPAGMKVVNVVRSGYVINDRFVPNLTETDQIGTPIRPGENNLPSDPIERQPEIISRALSQPDPYAFQNVGGFGTLERDRGAMPDFSEVTFVISLTGVNLQTPDPRATVLSAPAAGAVGVPSAPAAPAAGAAARPAGPRGGDDID